MLETLLNASLCKKRFPEPRLHSGPSNRMQLFASYFGSFWRHGLNALSLNPGNHSLLSQRLLGDFSICRLAEAVIRGSQQALLVSFLLREKSEAPAVTL